jgi:hypothetical protein
MKLELTLLVAEETIKVVEEEIEDEATDILAEIIASYHVNHMIQ